MSDLEYLKKQLSIARSEIHNLRKQLTLLSHVHESSIKDINSIITNYRCKGCQLKSAQITDKEESSTDTGKIIFQQIGVIKTDFPDKRAIPRQSSLISQSVGYIDIDQAIFNNPEQSLNGLDEFSHMWVIYHFHRNTTHAKPKVAPPRLNGKRVGVFSTRSPHRPCPIGLSLVEINCIEGNRIYFFGTDMVNGTPVLDLKPYIPIYDCIVDTPDEHQFYQSSELDKYGSREEPDGEETDVDAAKICRISKEHKLLTISPTIRVPRWVMSDSNLSVLFNDRAEQQMKDLDINKANIISILEADPRSVYLRTKYGSQIFTFKLGNVTVTCKFNDVNSTVLVVQVRKTELLEESGIHSASTSMP